MKKVLFLLFSVLFVVNCYSQSVYTSKNRDFDIEMDESIDGVWAGPDSTESVADSIYLYKTGIPDFGDLGYFDLELKMKSLWYGTKVYFLFRHLDDSLVTGNINGNPDTTIADGLENRDATAIYFFLDSTDARLESNAPFYIDNTYLDSILWFRWGWGSTEFEGQFKGADISSIDELGGEIVQWEDERYRYTKLSIDLDIVKPEYIVPEKSLKDINDLDSLTIPAHIKPELKLGFEVELDENDKEIASDSGFVLQTRAFWNTDLDSSALKPNNIRLWEWIKFAYGDTCLPCKVKPSYTKTYAADFATIFPNPASDYIFVSVKNFDKTNYRICNLMGVQVKYGTIYGQEGVIELQNIKTGTYYLQLINENGTFVTKKILKY